MLSYSLTKHARFCEPGVVIFSRRFLCRRTSRRQLGKNCSGSRQLRMLTWFSLIWSQIQFLVIIDYSFQMGKKHNEGLEPKVLSAFLAKMRFWYQNDPFNTENYFFMLSNTYNTSMAWYHQKMVGLSALWPNGQNADRTFWLWALDIESMQWPNRNRSC